MDTKRLRREVDQVPKGRRRRLPSELRVKLIAAAEHLRAGGASCRAIGEALGVTPETVRRWLKKSTPRSGQLLPVRIRRDEPGLAVVSPSGYRLEGVSLEQAADILRALG